MVVGMPGTEAEMETQHIEGGIGLQVIEDEEQLFLRGVELAFRPARGNLLDFTFEEPFLLDRVRGRCEGLSEFVEFQPIHSDDRFDNAAMLFVVQLFKLFVNHMMNVL